LAQVLRRLPVSTHPDLLVGTSSGDDAAVWRVDADRAMVATVDFFTPIVDDAKTWGAIAAANSASDVYAMGGRPLFALNVAAWPRGVIDFDVLGDVLEGAGEIATRGGWIVVGGHTVDGPEPMYGMSVVGEVHPDRIMTNESGRAGDVLVLTKAIGTGIISTALKRLELEATRPGGRLYAAYAASVSSMTQLNDRASAVARTHNVRCATDITGFGLTGHLHKLAKASGLAAVLNVADIPLIIDAAELLAEGFVPGGTHRNLEFVEGAIDDADGLWDANRFLLADPQTSGGLLMCLRPEHVADAVAELTEAGLVGAVIGVLTDTQEPGTLLIR
jgi:selenide, water dikinase